MDGTLTLQLYFDGMCRPNPGRGYYGWVLFDGPDAVWCGSGCLGVRATNNTAEYTAVLRALQRVAEATEYSDQPIEVYGDSAVVIHQLNGQWQCNSKTLQALRTQVQKVLNTFSAPVTFHWIPRSENTRADALALDAYVRRKGRP